MSKQSFYIVFIFLLALIISSCEKAYSQCYGISDTLGNSDPTINQTFNISPDVNPTDVTQSHSIRFRTSNMNGNWSLYVNNAAITRTSTGGPAAEDVKDSDVSYLAALTAVMVAGVANLVAPFNGATTLASINAANTRIVAGSGRSSGSCGAMSGSYWQLDVDLSVPQDFIFNIGTYDTTINYLLTSP